jgi:hypothetical protein
MLEKEPAAHGTQLVAPTTACHLPASHALHVLMPVLEYWPVAHAVQSPAAPPPATAAAPQVSIFVLLYHSKQVLYQ